MTQNLLRFLLKEFPGGNLFDPTGKAGMPVVEFIVKYSKEKNKLDKKYLQIRLVSNFSLLDDEKMKFLIETEKK